MDPFIGEIRLLPFTFAPQGWALCNGQMLSIPHNTALFSILGTTYGGDGKSTFALPDLEGRAVPGAGQGQGLQHWDLGKAAGEDAVTLRQSEMPQHHHNLTGLDSLGAKAAPAGDTFLAQDGRGGQGNIDYLAPSSEPLNTQLAPRALNPNGSGQAHENRQPFLSLNFCIALEGIYPSRS